MLLLLKVFPRVVGGALLLVARGVRVVCLRAPVDPALLLSRSLLFLVWWGSGVVACVVVLVAAGVLACGGTASV